MPRKTSPKTKRASEVAAENMQAYPYVGVKDMFVWESPERVYRPKDFNWILNSILIVLVVVSILLFLREFILIAVVLSIMFLIYVLATVPPRILNHKITTQGILVGDHNYLWDEIAEFWMEVKYDQNILVVETKLNFPNRLMVLLGDQDPEAVKNFLVNYVPYREKPIENWLDNLSRKVEKKLSL